MDLLITTKRSWTHGPKTKISCPKCQRVTPARSYQQAENIGLFFIPILRFRNNYVECHKCKTTLLCKVPLDEIDQYSADELDSYLYRGSSFIVKFLAITGLLLFWAPIVGLGVSLIAVIATIRANGWTKWVSLVGLVLSTIVTIAFFVLLSYAHQAKQAELQQARPANEVRKPRVHMDFNPMRKTDR